MNRLKKTGNPLIRDIFLAILTITIVVMILIEQYMASIVFAFLLIGDFFLRYKASKKQPQKGMTKISDGVANAMASKIIFESQQHRKNRDSHNYIKTGIDNQE